MKHLLYLSTCYFVATCFLFLSSAANITESTTDPKLFGIRVENVDKVAAISERGLTTVQRAKGIKVRLFGAIEEVTRVRFSRTDGCHKNVSLEAQFSADHNTAIVDLSHGKEGEMYGICLSVSTGNETPTRWMHQGTGELYKAIELERGHNGLFMPLPVEIALVVVLFFMSALFSGLTLGLMSLDVTELQLIMKCGKPHEQKYAEAIYPVRKHGNYLLCTLLLGNTIVNVGGTLLLENLTGALVSAFVTPVIIVLFGEIFPQSICSKYGLAVGAHTIWITRFFLAITFPISWPIAKILDKLIGKDLHRIYDKNRILELIRLSQDHETLKDSQEVKIIEGALQLSRKTAKDVMTPIQDVYMISERSILDTPTIAAILKSGYTRIPIFKGNNQEKEIVGLLNVKNLALIDPDNNTAVRTVCKFYKNPVNRVHELMPLMYLLEQFRKGNFHMALVERPQQSQLSEGSGVQVAVKKSKSAEPAGKGSGSDTSGADAAVKRTTSRSVQSKRPSRPSLLISEEPIGELIGVVTLEDIIEEILQAEIIDETDMVMDNVAKTPRPGANRDDIEALIGPEAFLRHKHVSSQLCFAAYQYLTTSIDQFGPNFVDPGELQALIRDNVIHHRPRSADKSTSRFIYRKDVPANYFILVLEGHVEVNVSAGGGFVFDAGPFFCFGRSLIEKAADLNQRVGRSRRAERQELNFIPDFTAEVVSDVTLLCIGAESYIKACKPPPAEKIARRLRKQFGNKPDTTAKQ